MSVRSTDSKVPRFYQYVKRYTTETNAFAANQVVYWQDLDDFIVTADVATGIGTSDNPLPAGVALGAYPGAGKYGFIQVDGICEAWCQHRACQATLLGTSAPGPLGGCGVTETMTSWRSRRFSQVVVGEGRFRPATA
jgi:hypothetical protein